MAMICCPICDHIFKASDDKPYRCPLCNWDGKWKPETAPEDEITKEIDHPALRGCH